jgi:hypothetical protein
MENNFNENSTHTNENKWDESVSISVEGHKGNTEGTNSGDSDQNKKRDDFVSLLADAIASTAFRSSDSNTVRKGITDILKTISVMSMQSETAIGLVVSGTLYRFGDYTATPALARLVAPAKIVACDVITAKDFLNRKAYENVPGKVLDPATFELQLRNICRMLRVNPNFVQVSRQRCMLLTEATKYAVNGRKVVDSEQTNILFLTQSFDNEADYSLELWAKKFAARGIDQ